MSYPCRQKFGSSGINTTEIIIREKRGQNKSICGEFSAFHVLRVFGGQIAYSISVFICVHLWTKHFVILGRVKT